ncbi:hypothetical protein SYNTR_1130 [Candidatus Syntrophocurvum alkaliphilum]|uniref:Sporulation protein YtxC n=1 Tax=Candidatus Syntrophocurvum alkaliphilum TaxID=2293317 RepID=A0A6I6DHG2_9FIRM|nr:putative sporulation protein YtxC [Candidatus Syntrophocurvum alkaliphilum]QGT99723.1 hypothetical protein SYNTR_1130 [Candidatus Syntrophocurvum alkaliphilum]
MTYKLKIITDGDRLLDLLQDNFSWLQERGYNLGIKVDREENASIINLELQGYTLDRYFNQDDIIYIFKHQMSELLAEYIAETWEKKLLWKEIIKNYKVISDQDKQIVYYKSLEFLRLYNNNDSINLLLNFSRKNKIANKILKYIEDNDFLVIEGFINFCMQDYLTEIKFAIELAYEELRNEKEYNEFIKLLRYFVETQPPRVFEVNLFMKEDGLFYLWDGNGVKIEEKYIDYYLDDIIMNDTSLDDVLISILITISPQKIVLHNTSAIDYSEPVEIIKKVFNEKIVNCSNCDRCLKLKSQIEQ